MIDRIQRQRHRSFGGRASLSAALAALLLCGLYVSAPQAAEMSRDDLRALVLLMSQEE